MTIADRIKMVREQNNLTQDELSHKMGYKDRSNISKIEASGNDISLKKISKVAQALGTTEAYLMGWEDDIVPPDTAASQMRKIMEGSDPQSEELLEIFSGLSSTDKELLLGIARKMK